MYSQRKADPWTMANEYRPVLAKLTSPKDTMDVFSEGARGLSNANTVCVLWIALKYNNSQDWAFTMGQAPGQVTAVLITASRSMFLSSLFVDEKSKALKKLLITYYR